MKNRLLLLLAPLVLLLAFALTGQAQTSSRIPTYRTYTGSISASNAVVTSLIAATDKLVIHSIRVFSTQAGTLTFTDGSSGVAVLCIGVAANVPQEITVEQMGPAGIGLTRGNELYCNALSSATLTMSMYTTYE